MFPFDRWFISRKKLREEMASELVLAREDERKRVEALEAHRFKEKEKQLKDQHSIELAQKDAKIESQNIEIARFLKRESNVGKVYYNSIRQTKKVLQIAVDISHETNDFTEDMLLMFQKIESIKEKAKRLDESYENQSGEMKKLLGHGVNLGGKKETKEMVAYYQCQGEGCGKYFDEFEGEEFKLAEKFKDSLCKTCREKEHRKKQLEQQQRIAQNNGNGNGHNGHASHVLAERKKDWNNDKI